MSYLYETHMHTSQGSSCGISRGRDYIQRYLGLGYSGIIITDHFCRGNTAIDRSLPWAKWVQQFCKGYEDAREEGARRGLDVFFGWEETFDGDDYLVYGLDKEWLLKHPESRGWTRKEQFEEVRRDGGCVVHAHPFRQYNYIKCIHLPTGLVDAVEAANSGNHQSFDAFAWAYAKKIGVTATAGSDIHRVEDLRGDTAYGVILDKKMKTIGDYVKAVKNNALKSLRVPHGRFYLYGDEMVMLPVDIRDKEGRRIIKSLGDFLAS
jgi:histidinol phosphatase-like PHP family hydrolase